MVNLNVSTKALNIKWGLIFYAIAIILYVIRIDKKKKKDLFALLLIKQKQQ